jgi:hypothetical protein
VKLSHFLSIDWLRCNHHPYQSHYRGLNYHLPPQAQSLLQILAQHHLAVQQVVSIIEIHHQLIDLSFISYHTMTYRILLTSATSGTMIPARLEKARRTPALEERSKTCKLPLEPATANWKGESVQN